MRLLPVVFAFSMLLIAACGGSGDVKDAASSERALIDSLEAILFADEGGMDNRAADRKSVV